MTKKEKIAPEVKKLLKDGFKPHGRVIPNPLNAPKGSGVFQFSRGKYDHASLVIGPNGKLIRGVVTIKGQHSYIGNYSKGILGVFNV